MGDSIQVEKVRVRAAVNGQAVDFLCDTRQSLLECLRDILGLTGTKEGCNDGNCGACGVLLNGRLVNSCLVLGVEIDGQEVLTIEGWPIGGDCTRSNKRSSSTRPSSAATARRGPSWRPRHSSIGSPGRPRSGSVSGSPAPCAAAPATTRSSGR